MKNCSFLPGNSRRLAWLPLTLLTWLLLACDRVQAPALADAEWLAFQARFCTESDALEVWETRDPEKLALLQSAFLQTQSEPLDHVIKSPNHTLVLVIQGEEAPETWHLTLRLDQTTMALFNVKQPEQSYLAQTDPMLYRALNTLLSFHMGESLDIFRRCEMAEN